jgi:hypothetical protein
MTQRGFPPPWSIEERQESFIVKDANGQQLAYLYFEDEPQRQMSKPAFWKSADLTECPGKSCHAFAGQTAPLLPAGRAAMMIPGRLWGSSRSEELCQFHLEWCDTAS